MYRGRLGIPQGFALPQFGMARVKRDRWGMQRAELPQGYTSVTAARLVRVSRRTRGLSGGQPVPLTGRATHPTAIRFFLPSFFSSEKKAEEHTGGTEGAVVGNAVKDGAFKGVGAGIGGKIGVIPAEDEKETGIVGVGKGEESRVADKGSHIGVGDVIKPGIVADPGDGVNGFYGRFRMMRSEKFKGFKTGGTADIGSHFATGGNVNVENPVTGRGDVFKFGTGNNRFS